MKNLGFQEPRAGVDVESVLPVETLKPEYQPEMDFKNCLWMYWQFKGLHYMVEPGKL